jgi:hypothetical protein
MLTSIECRQRALGKIAEAELQPRHNKRLVTAAQGWLILAEHMARLEASFGSRRQTARRDRLRSA